jgi:hypothetical protein
MPRDFMQPVVDPLVLHSFRFRDPLSGKWVRARYRAERAEIAARYREWEIVGSAELRQPHGRSLNPWRPA